MNLRGPLVLLASHERPMPKLLRIILREGGLRTVEANSRAEALESAAAHNPDLVLLDVGCSDDCIEVIRRLRERMAGPIFVVSSWRHREQEEIAALDAGANDYLAKPFSSRFMLARIRVWLRQTARGAEGLGKDVIEVGELRIDLEQRMVFAAGHEVQLTPIEYRLLATLMRNQGCFMTYQQLLVDVWGQRYASRKQYLFVYMGHLRRKLEVAPAHPRYILTKRGFGYRLGAA